MVNIMLESKATVEEKAVICRLCMKCNEDSLNIFMSNAVKGMAVWEIIRDLLILEVAEGDGLPDTVCCQCLRKLIEFSEFKEMCMKTIAELKKNIMKSGLMIELKEGVAWSESHVENESYGSGNLGMDGAQKRAVNKVASNSLEMENRIFVKEEVHPREAIIEEETYQLENLGENDAHERSVPDVCVPSGMGNLIDIKEEVDPGDSQDYREYRGDNLGSDGSEERPVSGVACDPLEMNCMVDMKREGNPIQLLDEKEVYRWQNLDEDVTRERPVSDVVCVPLNMGTLIAVKEEYVCDESLGGGETYRRQNFGQDEYRERAVNNDHSHEMGNMVNGSNIKEMGTEKNQFCGRAEYACSNCGFKCCNVIELTDHTCGPNVNERALTSESPKEKNSHEGSTLKWTKVHGSLKPFKCETCGKCYALKHRVIRHLSIHTGLKPFKCETCGKAFAQKSTLVRHLVLHTGLKPFKCETCLKEFTQKGNLHQHLAVHSGLKPFKCENCGKNFGFKSNLLKHLTTHSGLKPFK